MCNDVPGVIGENIGGKQYDYLDISEFICAVNQFILQGSIDQSNSIAKFETSKLEKTMKNRFTNMEDEQDTKRGYLSDAIHVNKGNLTLL